jgi:PAS domain S-box-containing protein
MLGTKVQGRVWSFRDVTVRKRAEENLVHSQEETAHANRLLMALSQAAQAVQLARTTEEAYGAIQNQLTQMGYHTTGFELSENGQSLHITYLNYEADLVRKAEKVTGLSLRDFHFPWRVNTIYHRAIVKGETVFIKDAAQAVADVLPKKLHSLARPMADLFKLDQSIFAPLKVGEEMIGILAVTGPDLSATDNPAITAFANQTAIAIQNTRLYVQAHQEISERKQAEELLAASEAELRALFASMQDVVMVIDHLGVYLEIAPTNPDLLVKPPEQLLGKNLRDVFPPVQAETFINVVQQVLDTRKTTHIEYDLVIGNQTVWFETSISPMTKTSTLWVARDITDRKQAEETLREGENLLRESQIIAGLGSYVLDIPSGMWKSSDVLDKVFGIDEAYERSVDGWVALIHPDDRAMMVYHFSNEVLGQGMMFDKEYRIIRRDDQANRWVHGLGKLEFNAKGQPLKMHGTIQDITGQKMAEEALIVSQQSYQGLVERIPGVIYRDTLDEKASTLFISPQIKDLSGYSPEEWQADPDLWLNILHPDDRARVMAENKHHYTTGEQFKSDYRLLARDGRIVWIRDEAVSIYDSSGHPLYDQGVFTDITERKLSEEQLRLSEERYRMLAENMSDTVWLMDMSLRTTYISPSVTRLRGFTLDEINSIPLDRQMPPESLQRALQLFAETLSPENLTQTESLISRTIELEFFKKNGTKFWSENTFTVIRDSQGQPIAILGSGRDISERKHSEVVIQNSEKYFRALIENNTDAVVLVDPRGMLLYESPQNARMLGRAPGQRLGKSGYDFIHPEDRGFVAQMLKELVQHPGEIRQTTFRNQHKDGSWRWIEATATNLLGESAVHGLVINMHDITERKQAEEEIRRRVADLEVLYENSLSLSVLLEPRKIAKNMVKVLSQKLDWHHATIQLVHPETRRLELLALNKPGLTPNQTQVEFDRLNKIFDSPNQGLSGWVIKNGKTIRSGDVRTDKRHLSTFPEIRSGLYVPLMIGERAIGSIAVESRQENRFSEEDERLLQTLAVQSAIAFENARLYQDAVRAARRKAALHQGSLEIGRAGQEIEALCVALHDAVQQVMPAEAFTVSLITEDGLEVEAPYLIDRGIRHPNTRQPLGVGITGRVIKSQKPLRLKDVQKSKGVKPILVSESEPTRSVLSVPLLVQNKIIGVISTQSFEPNVYTIEDQIFMETLASEAAIAFENARLFDEISHRLVELESLSQVSDSLTSAIDLQPLLENILAGARNAIPAAEKGTISLAEPDGVLRLHAVSGYTDPRLMGLVLANQKGYAARVAIERIPLKIDDAQAGYEAPYIGKIEEIDAVQSGIAAPLIVKGKVIGVISLDNASRKAAFIESDLRLLVTFASSVAVAIENARLFTETQQRLHRLSALHSIDAAIGASVDIKVTLNIVLEHVLTELKADAAAVLLFNPLTRMLEYTAGSGFRVHVIEGMRLRLGEGLAGQSVLQRRAINIADIRLAYEVEQVMERPISGPASVPLQYLEGENFVSYHSMPLIAKGQVQGVLEIFRRTPMKVDQEWITFFEMLAGQTALAIDNGRLFENLQHSNLELTLAYDATIQGWSQALELRDEETGGHTQRVTDLTLNLIQAMGLEEVEMEHARRGSLLHDIGKIAVPDSILLKPGPLDEHEWNVMHQHPQYAYNMLSPITYLAPAIHIPWCHHEKWDGSGYPRGLKGEAIPMVARIFAIVDVYDALTSNRPYRLAWTSENAMEYIREQSGLHFDPKVVKAFMDLMANEK